jgi:GT2 family glycosyltransferase
VPTVYVIVLNWNGWRETLRCLEALQALEYSRWRAVVLDNGSEDASLERVRAWAQGRAQRVRRQAPALIEYSRREALAGGVETAERSLGPVGAGEGLVLVSNGENLGFAAGCNVGISYALIAGADFVFLLNNDALVTPSTLEQLMAAARTMDAAIAGATALDKRGGQVLFNGNSWPKQMFFSGRLLRHDPSARIWPSSDAQGGAMLLRRDLLERRFADDGHYLDPGFFMYREDTDLCRYADSRGYLCLVAGEAVVEHGFATSSGGVGHPRVMYYMTRNRVHLARRWLSSGWRLLFHLYYAPSRLFLLLLRPRNWTSGRGRAVLWGVIDGYRGVAGEWRHHARPSL